LSDALDTYPQAIGIPHALHAAQHWYRVLMAAIESLAALDREVTNISPEFLPIVNIGTKTLSI